MSSPCVISTIVYAATAHIHVVSISNRRMIGHQDSVTSADFDYKTCRIRQSSLHRQSVFLCIKYKSEKYVQILDCMAAVWRTRPCMTTKMTKESHHAEHEYSTGINLGVRTVTEEFGYRNLVTEDIGVSIGKTLGSCKHSKPYVPSHSRLCVYCCHAMPEHQASGGAWPTDVQCKGQHSICCSWVQPSFVILLTTSAIQTLL